MNDTLAILAKEIELSATSDRHRLWRQWRDLSKQVGGNKPHDRALNKLRQAISASVQWVQQRRERVPAIEFPQALPVCNRREEIAAAIAAHQIIILAGETGSGKTTQIPKICLGLGRGINGLIGHTQPRRIAARTVASRIAEELKVPLGESVGYQVRFTDHCSQFSHIKLMTDGILLAEIQHDRYLNRYDTLIIDEAHERSLNIDFLLGYLKLILPSRPDLKVIVTSATIDLPRFSRHFDNAPIIEVSGRTYPVTTHYHPLADDQDDQFQAIVDAIDEIQHWERQEKQSAQNGDILVFLSGEREIREAAAVIRKAQIPHMDVLPLYARLSLAEQNRVFQGHRGRRIVLATNVAETSITVPGIRYVIDPGFARISRYSYRTKVQRLPIEAISQASAEQRKGRCGRVSNGICIRLYEQTDFNNRPEFTDAEILRTNLAAVILQMLNMRIGDIRDFPFIDKPDKRLINDGFSLLQQLNAVNRAGKLTALGRQLGALPVDPRLSRMVIAAGKFACVREILILVSALSVQDPRERPADKQQAADEKHRRFHDDHSDFITYLNLWDYFENQRQALSQSQFRKQCKKDFLSYIRLREWRDVHFQLRLACKSADFRENTAVATYENIHCALIAGLLSNIGFRTEDKDYLGARNQRFHIFPGSFQFKKTPKWILCAQLLETSKLYAHTVAKIDPQWVVAAAQHLLKRHYFEPHYDSRRGQVMAYEKVSLYGLVLVEKQRVGYADIDAKGAREVFIRAALVEGKYRGRGKFFTCNQQMIQALDELEAKSRRRDILVDESVLYDFYAERIPEDIVNLASFEHWREQVEREQPRLLYLTRELLMQHGADNVTEAQFPNELGWEGLVFKLSYHFEPGHKDDGVSIEVPVSALHLVPQNRLQWVVPGMLREKCIGLVKKLPKQWRKKFVPVPDYIDKALAGMQADNTPLVETLGFQLQRLTAVSVPPDVWQQVSSTEDYYCFNIKVIDDEGHCIDSGRDLGQLRERYRDQLQKSLQAADNSIERQGITVWDFDELPEVIELDRGAMRLRAYPALIDNKTSVSIELKDDCIQAKYASARGMVRLLLLTTDKQPADQPSSNKLSKDGLTQNQLSLAQPVKYLRKELLKGKDVGLLSIANLGNRDLVIDDLLCAACVNTCLAVEPLPRVEHQFQQCIKLGQSQLVTCALEIESLLVSILTAFVEIKKQLKSNKNTLVLAFAVSDINDQLRRLIYPGFLYSTPLQWLRHYPRYLKAVLMRIDRMSNNVQKDKLHIAELTPHWERLDQRVEQEGDVVLADNAELQTYRWMLEEFRVSIFAQTLKTLMPVSTKRLNKQWQLTL